MNGSDQHRVRLPVALPVAPSTDSRSGTSEAPQSRLGVGNHPLLGSPVRRMGRRHLETLADRLSARDIELLRLVASHRFIATKQIEALLFSRHASAVSGARTCRRVLRRLDRELLLESLERRVGGTRAGSASSIWRLSHAGQRLLALVDGNGAVAKLHEPSERLLNHCLMVAEIHVAIAQAATEHGLEILTIQTEPSSWREHLGLAGERRILKPDLSATTATTEYEDHWLLEADTGSEHPPTVVLKCRQYLDYFAGLPTGDVVPRVVWVVPNRARLTKLREAFSRAGLDTNLFLVVELADLADVISGGDT